MRDLKDCALYRRELHDEVEGLEVGAELRRHLLDCVDCRALRDELLALDEVLLLSIEPPPPGLASRIVDACHGARTVVPVRCPSPVPTQPLSLLGAWVAGSVGLAFAILMGFTLPQLSSPMTSLLSGTSDLDWWRILSDHVSLALEVFTNSPTLWPVLPPVAPPGLCDLPFSNTGTPGDVSCILLALGALLGSPAVLVLVTPTETPVRTSTRRSS